MTPMNVDAGIQPVQRRLRAALFQQQRQQRSGLADAEPEYGDRGDRRRQAPAALALRRLAVRLHPGLASNGPDRKLAAWSGTERRLTADGIARPSR